MSVAEGGAPAAAAPRRSPGRRTAAAPGRRLHERLDRASFRLVLLTFVASILFASTPLPFGGPNVILAGAAIGVFALRMLTKRSIDIHWSFALFLLSGLLLTVWAIQVHASTGTMEPTRIGQIGMGLGIAAATYAALTPGNVRFILYAIVLSVLASALFGMAVLYSRDVFEPLWRAVATVDESQLWPVLEDGSLAGATNSIDTFSSHMAMAVPITFGMWLQYTSRDSGKTGRTVALNLLLLFQAAAVLMTNSRSLAIGVFLGGAAILIARMTGLPRGKTPGVASRLFLTVSCLYVAGVLLIHRDDLAGGHPGAEPMLQVSARPAGLPAPAPAPGRSEAARRSCAESLGELFPPVSVSGKWSEDCAPLHRTRSHEKYARYYSFVMGKGAFLAIRAVTDAECCRLLLLRGTPAAWSAAVRPLQQKDIEAGPDSESDSGPDSESVSDPDAGLILARLRRGEYTLAVVTDDRGLPQRFKLEITFDMARSWFPSPDLERFFSIGTLSSQHRYRMFEVAHRYALEHPLGAGGYFPEDRHLAPDMGPELRKNLTETELHNHLLVVLSHYGLPGLALSLLFFGCLFWSALHSVVLARRLRDAHALYLSGAMAGVSAACFVIMSLFPVGPFYRGWHYFLAFGLVFGVQRILAVASGEIPRRGPPDGRVVEVAHQGVRLEHRSHGARHEDEAQGDGGG